MGSNNNKPYLFYKHKTHSGSEFLNLMTLASPLVMLRDPSPSSPEGEDKDGEGS
jgi:hypothetical protein